MLLYEAKLLKHLEGGAGIAHVHYSGSEGLAQSFLSLGHFWISRWFQHHGDGSPWSIFGGPVDLVGADVLRGHICRTFSAAAAGNFPSRLSCSLGTR